MITILNEKKSSAGSPYIFYTITVNPSNRTANTVDLEIKVTSHLQYSSSSLGTGVLTGYFKINNTNYSVNIKSKSESWSGTTKHTTTKQITIEDLTGSQTLLEDITFRVARETGSSSSSGYLKETMCSDIEIPIGHTAPDNISYTITETDLTLQRLGIANNVFVENKSIKKFLFSYNLYDDATLSKVSIWNGASAVYSSNTNPLILDLKTQPLPSKNENGKITLKGKVTDSMNGSSFADGSGWDLYDVIEYTIPTINETLTTAKRNGQLTGKVLTNLVGAFFKGEIGNYNQQNLLSIKYKFWENSSSIEEPTEYSNTIPSESILYTNNTFKVLNYEIGSDNESDSNYFNPKKSYKIKFLIKDIFNEIESSIRAIPVGESTWTEYKDRVEFKKITIQNKDIVDDIIYANNNVLWGPDYYFMSGSNTINLSQKVSEQKNGIVLVWQAYSDGAPQPWEYNFTFIPKWQVITNSSRGVVCLLATSHASYIGTKYVYLFDNKITGHNDNSTGATKGNSGITTTNNHWVLTHVLGV